MSAALPKTEPSENGLRRLPGVVGFKVGEHTSMVGKTRYYTPEYLQSLADNFTALKQDADYHVEPPAVLGHEVVQAKLAEILAGDDVYKTLMADSKATSGGGPGRTDEPAAGWPDNVKFDAAAGHLTFDLERIPPSVADMIDTGQLRYPSVEIKEGVVHNGKPVEPFIWRVGLLGGTPPGCKAVPPLGQSHFADLPPDVVCFADAGGAESLPAAPDKPVLSLLQKVYKFLSSAFLSSLTRPQVDQLAIDAAAAMDGEADATTNPGVTAMADALPALTDADRKAVAESIKAALLADLKATLTPDLTASLTAAFADREKALAEQQKANADQAAAIKAAADGAIKTFADREAEESRKKIDAFCDAERGVRIRPAELDESNPKTAYLSLRQQMYRADAKSQVTCFADNGTEVKKTPLEIMMDAVKARPVLAFGDRVEVKPADDERTARKKRIAEWAKSRQPAKVG